MHIRFLTLDTLDTQTQEQVNQLFGELTPSKPLCVKELLQTDNPPYIAVCFEQETPIGMATMVTYEVISGKKAWIEDVIVSQNFRQQGIGEKLTQTLIDKAKELKISTILLYSNPKRQAAHRLYKRLGFVPKESTLFVMSV